MPLHSLPYDLAIGPLVHVGFSQAGSLSSQPQGQGIAHVFLIDTGASVTAISPEVAGHAGLRSLGKTRVSVPSGPVELNTYLVDLLVLLGNPQKGLTSQEIPHFPAHNLRVIEYLGNTAHYHGLLGRDILNQGRFVLNGNRQKYTLELPDTTRLSVIGSL